MIMTTTDKTGDVELWTAGPEVERAPVLVMVLVLRLMFVLLELEAFVTMSEMQAMEVPTVSANAATAAERTVQTALWPVVVVRSAIVTAVCKTGVMAVATAGTQVERAPVLAVTVLMDLLLDLVELALVATKFGWNTMTPPTVNANVATAAVITVVTALMRLLVTRDALVAAVGKTSVMAVARGGTRVERAPVHAEMVLLDLLLDLVELAFVATKFGLNAMAPPTVNANVATAAVITVATMLMRLLVKRPAIVAAVDKAGLMAVARAGTKVRRALVPVLVLVLDLMFELLDLEAFGQCRRCRRWKSLRSTPTRRPRRSAR